MAEAKLTLTTAISSCWQLVATRKLKTESSKHERRRLAFCLIMTDEFQAAPTLTTKETTNKKR